MDYQCCRKSKHGQRSVLGGVVSTPVQPYGNSMAQNQIGSIGSSLTCTTPFLQHNEQPPTPITARILSLACPIALQNFLYMLLGVINTACVGRLGASALAAVVLAQGIYNVTGQSLIFGLAAGVETLAGQSFGAGNYKQVGIVLQRALIINLLAATIVIVGAWAHMQPILQALGQEPHIAAAATSYLHGCIVGFLVMAVDACISRFLLVQVLLLLLLLTILLMAHDASMVFYNPQRCMHHPIHHPGGGIASIHQHPYGLVVVPALLLAPRVSHLGRRARRRSRLQLHHGHDGCHRPVFGSLEGTCCAPWQRFQMLSWLVCGAYVVLCINLLVS